MKLRDIKNLPVFYQHKAQVLGKVKKVVIGDDYKILYLVIDTGEEVQKMVFSSDFLLGEESVVLLDLAGMKSYAHGEELSIYQQKVGDSLFDNDGKELGVLSDFVINIEGKEVEAVEISAGAFKDLLEGRNEVPIAQVEWSSKYSAVLRNE